MKKHTLAWKSGMVCIGAAIGAFFGPLVYKKSDVAKVAIQKRVSKNLGVIERYMDKKYGKGFFKERVLRHVTKTEILDELKKEEDHSLDYMRTLPTH